MAIAELTHVPAEFAGADAKFTSLNPPDGGYQAKNDSRPCTQCGHTYKYTVGYSVAGEIWRCLACGAVNRAR